MLTEATTVSELVAIRIRKARYGRGLSQAELAEALHTTQATVSRWESGNRQISLDDLGDVAVVLALPLTYFVDVRGPA